MVLCDQLNVMKWREINNVREWGRFKVHHKADTNEFVSFMVYKTVTRNRDLIMHGDVCSREVENFGMPELHRKIFSG